MSNQSTVGSFRVSVDHHEYPHIASAFAVKDLEYIRKRINANRNIYNSLLDAAANRTYESIKTLIDAIVVVYESGAGIYEVVPIRTIATVNAGTSAEVTVTGKFKFNTDDPDTVDGVTYNIAASFTRYPSSKEVFTVTYNLSWGEDVSPSGSPGEVSWTDVYPNNPNTILGYSENFPAPSLVAGKMAENLIMTVKELWREEETESSKYNNDEDGDEVIG